MLAGTHFGGCGWRKLSADATPAMVRIIIPASRRLMSRRTCPSKSHYRPPETPRPHSVQTDTRTSVIEIVLPGMLCSVVGRRPKVSKIERQASTPNAASSTSSHSTIAARASVLGHCAGTGAP